MKKMMMMAAVVLTAALTQAASVSWGIINVRVPTKDARTITTSNAKFTVAQAAADLVMKLYVVPADGSAPVDLNTTAALTSDGTKSSSVLWDQATTIANRTSYGTTDANKSVTLRLLSTYTSGSDVYTLSLDVTKALNNIESQATTYTFNMLNQTWTLTTVPEPTSMALLLLGIAALALKRRV